MKTVVFDTNVWVSAIAFRGRVRPLLKGVLQRRYRVAVSQEILDETARVLGGRAHDGKKALVRTQSGSSAGLTPFFHFFLTPFFHNGVYHDIADFN